MGAYWKKYGQVQKIINWLEPVYSNSNKTITFSWDYDAKTAVWISDFSSYKQITVIDLTTGNAWRAMNSTGSRYWYEAKSLSAQGFTVDACDSRHLGLTHATVTFANSYLIPISDNSVLSYFT